MVPPFPIIFLDDFLRRMFSYRLGCYCEIIFWMILKDLCIDLGILLEEFRHFLILEDCTIRTLRLTCRAVDTFVRVNEQLLSIASIINSQPINAIHRADFHAGCILAV